MIDYWKLVKEYKIGDVVQRHAPGQGGYSISPFVGRVTAVHRGIGFLAVQWPYGNEQVSPEEVVRVDPRISQFLPPTLVDQTYMSVSTEKARKLWASKSPWRTTEVPPGFHVDLAKLWSKKAGEVAAYDEMWRKYASHSPDDVIRDEVSKFYTVASNLWDLRLKQHTEKTAAYWVAQNRQYRVTTEEFSGKKPCCPKCGTKMKRTTYKMDKGSRQRLFACPKDLFLVKVTDILGPDGQPVEW